MTSGGVLALFVEEVAEHVVSLRSALSGLRSQPSDEDTTGLVGRLRRNAHGIVGSAWAVGLDPVAQLMQAVEVACVDLAHAGTTPSPTFPDAVAATVDATEAAVAAAAAGEPMPPSIDVDKLTAAVAAAVAE